VCVCVQLTQAQNHGFIGSKNMFTINLSSLIQQEMNAQYRFHLKKHQTFLIEYAYQNITNPIPKKMQIDLKHTNHSFGIGFLMNNTKLHMPMPIGFYYGLKINRHWGKLNQNMQDSILQTFNHSSILPTIILGRGIVLSPKLMIDISIDAGMKFGQYTLAEEVENDDFFEPIILYPYNLPFVKKTPKFSLSDGGSYSYKMFHCMPSIKFGFLF